MRAGSSSPFSRLPEGHLFHSSPKIMWSWSAYDRTVPAASILTMARHLLCQRKEELSLFVIHS